MNFPLKIIQAVLKEVLRDMELISKRFRLHLCPLLKGRFGSAMRSHRSITILRVHVKHVNGNCVTIVEPKRDRCFELRSGSGLLVTTRIVGFGALTFYRESSRSMRCLLG